MLFATADRSIRALLVLARTTGQRPLRADEIAAATGAPQNCMAKTLNALQNPSVFAAIKGMNVGKPGAGE